MQRLVVARAKPSVCCVFEGLSCQHNNNKAIGEEVSKLSFRMVVQTLEGGVPVIELQGEIDVYTAPQLKQQMIVLMEDGARQILINLSHVDYMDSTALGVLIGGLKRIREMDGNMALICPAPRTRRVFEVTGLDKIFDIYNSQSEALEAVGKGN